VPKRRIAHRGFELSIVDAVEFEREKQEVQRRSCYAFLDVAIEFGADGVGRVAGINQ